MAVTRFSRKKKITIAAIFLLAFLLEVYAHSYVEVNELSVISEDEADKLWHPVGPFVDGYSFAQSNCIWFVKWNIERPTSST